MLFCKNKNIFTKNKSHCIFRNFDRNIKSDLIFLLIKLLQDYCLFDTR